MMLGSPERAARVAPVTVLIADAREQFRSGLVSILLAEPDITVVGEARDGLEAIDKTLSLKPRVILLDMNLTLCDGVEAISRIRNMLPRTMIVIMNDSKREEDVLRTLSLGAQGYLLKGSSNAEIASVIRGAAAGQVMLSPAIATALIEQLYSKKPETNLSRRELEVLEFLAQGLSNHEVAARMFVSENTVKTYVRRLREKLNLHSRLELGIYASRRELNNARAGVTPISDVATPMSSSEASITICNQEQGSAAPMSMDGEFKPATALCVELGWRQGTKRTDQSDKLLELADEILALMSEEVLRYHGTVAWFTANGFISIFGAPSAQEYAPQKALYAAVAILERMKGHAEQLRMSGFHLDIRIGISSGVALVRSGVGGLADARIQAGAVADLAAGACGMAQPGTIVVTDTTYRLTMHEFAFELLGELRTEVQREPVNTYRLLGYGPAKSRLEAAVLSGLTSFVGRDKEIAALKEAFAKAVEGLGQLVGIVGEAGIGKSRLILQFIESLSQEKVTLMHGSCLNYGESIPYLPCQQALRSHYHITEGEKESVVRARIEERLAVVGGDPSRLLPPLQELLSLNIEDQEYLRLDPQQKRSRIFEAIRDGLFLESQRKTVVLVIEDLHWIDKTSEELLSYLIDGLAGLRVLLILAYRPEYSHQWGSRSMYTQIRVDELPASASVELTNSILHDGKASPELQKLISDRAGGNPLFQEELVHSLLENGSIRKEDHLYVLAGLSDAVNIPDSLHGIIAARIDCLDRSTKHVMKIASVIGRSFNYGLLEKLIGTKIDLKPCLLALQRAALIYQKSVLPEPEYVFKHALTQEVAYHSLRPKLRRETHRKTGEAIEEQYTDRLEEFCEVLAHHYLRGESWEKAYEYLKMSGGKASQNYANWEALSFYKEAIAILQNVNEIEENKRRGIEIRLQMIRPLTLLGYPEDSLEILAQGAGLSRELDDKNSLGIFLSSMGFYFTMHGDPLKGRTYTELYFQEAEKTQDIRLMTSMGFDLCLSYQLTGDYFKIIDVAPKVIELIEKTGSQFEFFWGRLNSYSVLLGYYGCALGMIGDFENGKHFCEKAIGFALKLNDLASACWVEILCGGGVSVSQGDGEGAVECCQKAIEYAEDTQFITVSAIAWMGKGVGYYFQREFKTALTYLKRSIEMQSSAGVAMALSNPYIFLSWVELAMGDVLNALTHIDEALRLAQKNNERYLEATARCTRGLLLGKIDKQREREAEEEMIKGINILNELKMKPRSAIGVLFLGEFYADTGRKEKALQHLENAEASFSEMGMDYWLRRTQELLDKLQQ